MRCIRGPPSCVTLTLTVCVSARRDPLLPVDSDFSVIWFPPLCLLSTGYIYQPIPLLSILSVGFHYQIPMLALSARFPLPSLSVFRAFSSNVVQKKKTLMNATKSSPPVWVHSYPSCPLTGRCIWANTELFSHGWLRELHEKWILHSIFLLAAP